MLLYYRNQWLDQIKSHQSQLIPIEEVEKNKHWFEYIHNKNHPEHSTYRCRLCNQNYDKLNLEPRYKNALAYPEGTLKFTKRENKQIISEHANIPGHMNIIQLMQRKYAKR